MCGILFYIIMYIFDLFQKQKGRQERKRVGSCVVGKWPMFDDRVLIRQTVATNENQKKKKRVGSCCGCGCCRRCCHCYCCCRCYCRDREGEGVMMMVMIWRAR